MKNLLLIVFCLLTAVAVKAEQPLSSQDKHLRDSIFQVYNSISSETARVDFMHEMLQRHIGKQWIIELLDSALVLAVDGKYPEGEVNLNYDYYYHYKYQADTAKMYKAFRKLEIVSRKYKIYDMYFTAWGDILQFKTVRGDTESVMFEALRMGEEARKLNNLKGIYNSQLTVARALETSKQEDEAIVKYQEILEILNLPKLDKAMVYNELSDIYQLKADYEKAVWALEMQRTMTVQAMEEEPDKADKYRERMLDLELSFCSLYLAIPETDNLLKYLEKAQKYYTPDCLFSYKITYHTMWGGYYYLVDKWDDCFREFDIALSACNGTQPLYQMSIRMMKGQALQYAGYFKEAAENYCRAACEMDSLNRDVLRLHEEALQANYVIRQALLDRATAEKQYNLIWVVLVVLLITVMLMLLVRTIYVRKILIRSEKEMREALETVEAANKMKEVFLRNITYQVRIPLNAVVGFSELLSMESDLPSEQMQEYAALIKKNADHLTQLIFDILDLSRLESGMMKFNVQECEAVQMCRDAKMMVEMQEGNAIQLRFHTELDALMIKADSGRFIKLLLSVLSTPKEYEGTAMVEYTLTCEEAAGLKIVVYGSPLAKANEESQSSVQHDINRLYLETFKGSYLLLEENGEKVIIITYPIN